MQLFNDYADQANYYDLCLLIYHAADYHNSSTIAQTWESFISQIHDEVTAKRHHAGPAVADLPQPYEAVVGKVQAVAHRTSMDNFIFPTRTILPLLVRYSIEQHQDGEIGAAPTWPVRLLMSLDVTFDMITRSLEEMFSTQDGAFAGAARIRLVELVVFTVDAWSKDVRRRGVGSTKGDGSLGVWVKELLQFCEDSLPPPGQGSNPGGADVATIRLQLRELKRAVDGILERGNAAASLRYM